MKNQTRLFKTTGRWVLSWIWWWTEIPLWSGLSFCPTQGAQTGPQLCLFQNSISWVHEAWYCLFFDNWMSESLSESLWTHVSVCPSINVYLVDYFRILQAAFIFLICPREQLNQRSISDNREARFSGQRYKPHCWWRKQITFTVERKQNG